MRLLARIDSIVIKGFRGFKDEFRIDAGGEPVLICGPNGSGKSSVADALEWFFSDGVAHLSSAEVGKTLEALKNEFVSGAGDSFVKVVFSGGSLESVKSITSKKGGLAADHSNKSDEFKSFIAGCARESFILRSATLTGFITATKGEKLKKLADIIGFEEVTKVKTHLVKTLGDLKKELKSKNYENEMSRLQSNLLTNLNRNAYQDAELLTGVNDLLRTVDQGASVGAIGDIDAAVNSLAAADPGKISAKLMVMKELKSSAENCVAGYKAFESDVAEFKSIVEKLKAEFERINKIFIESLLANGEAVLKNPAYADETCPLCLQPVNKTGLIADIERRLKELGEIKAIKDKFASYKRNIHDYLSNIDMAMAGFLKKDAAILLDDVFKTQKAGAAALIELAAKLKAGFNIELIHVMSYGAPPDPLAICAAAAEIAAACEAGQKTLESAASSNASTAVAVKVSAATNDFKKHKELGAAKEALEKQIASVDRVLNNFLTRQKDSINKFLSAYSSKINAIYQRLNPGENNENFRLASVIGSDDELAGLSLEFEFQNQSTGSPLKYLSESHLNALGIALFLTAASAFNKNCDFIVLDDVISSFDNEHRERFAEFMKTDLADKQVIMMTHDGEWGDSINIMYCVKWNTVELHKL